MKNDELLSLRQMANRYGVSKKTIKRWWEAEGLLPLPDVKRPRLRWSLTAIEAWEAGKKMGAKVTK